MAKDPDGPLPGHLADLPADDRGFRVPAEAPYENGAPVISKVDPRLTLLLVGRRACAVCGYQVLPGEMMYRLWADEDVETVRRQATQPPGFVDDQTGLGHLSCMLYSGLVCPHWRTSGARLGKDSQFGPASRGPMPALVGFRHSLLMIDPNDLLGLNAASLPKGLHHSLVEVVPFNNPAELEGRYNDAVAAEDGLFAGRQRYHAHPDVPTAQPFATSVDELLAELKDRSAEAMPIAYSISGQIRERLVFATPLGSDLTQQVPEVMTTTSEGTPASPGVPQHDRTPMFGGNRAARRAAQRRQR